MKDYGDLVTADLRLTVLRILSAASGYELNGSILRLALERYGLTVSLDRLHTELAWLDEQRLVTQHLAGSVHVARLTVRGLDAAFGRAQVPGVARPEPEEGW